ncbi:MAG: ADOP family duplicated permease [Blastocatellia bacterium]
MRIKHWFYTVPLRLRSIFRRSRIERELDEEFRYHIDRQIEELIAKGMTPEEARNTALRDMGGVERRKEECRDMRRVRWVEDLMQDLRYGLRTLGKSPGFTAVAALTLALGIGANTAIFGVVNAVLLRPLPFKDPEQLVMVWYRAAEAAGGDHTPLGISDLVDLRAQSRSFADIEAFAGNIFNYTGGDSPERVMGAAVTARFFSMLGAQPQLGRTFSPDEDRPGAQRVAVLSDGFWRKYFAADPQVVGRAINLSGVSYNVIGVMPAKMDFPSRDVELWTAMQLPQPTRRGPHFLTGVARLKSGVGLDQARAEVMNSLKSSFSGDISFNLVPVNEFIVGDVRLALLILLGTVTLVTLIAVVNVANLMLARSAARAREISIRAALGAGRVRLIRQLLTESMLLALIGGLLGLLFALVGVELLLRIAPEGIPRLDHVRIDGYMLGWTALVSLLASAIFGLAPAWQSSRLNPNQTLKDGGRGVTESRGKRRWRDLLVVSELTLAIILLIGAGLFIKSFWRLQRVDSGVNTERALTMQIALFGRQYADRQKVDAFHSSLLERIKALPGVRAAALSNSLPPDRPNFSDLIMVEGRPPSRDQAPLVAFVIRVSQEYFGMLDIPLHRGRYFSAADSASSPPVAMINETTARQFFHNEDPIGKRINIHSEGRQIWREIVGVVGDVKYNGLPNKTQPAFYEPLAQASSPFGFLIVKTESADPLSLVSAVRNEVKALDRELPLASVRALDEHFALSIARPRFQAMLVTLFAALALILASVGVYGVISYSVTQRTHEMGVRIALGAHSRDVLALVARQGMTLVAIGVAIGLAASFALTRLMKTLLFGVSPTDAMTFVLIPLLLTVVAIVACLIPARRATKVDPLVALRHD